MTRREKPVVVEPPWVWGPSEVNEWIRAAYPSKRRHGRSVREGPEVVTRLRIVVEESDATRVRTATEEALASIGLTPSAPSKERPRRRIETFVRRSLLGERLHVSLRFAPPIHVSSCRKIVERLGERVRVHAVSTREERVHLPAKAR